LKSFGKADALPGKFGNNMNILITGSDGYIGSVLGPYLVNKGFHVTGLDTGFYKGKPFYNGMPQLTHTINKDIRKIIRPDLFNINSVIHLAELSNDPLGENDPKTTYKINHLGTKYLASECKKAEVAQFIYFSSCSVYGASAKIMTEESELNPQTEYAKCKVLNEEILLSLADNQFSPVILRNATVFGVSPRMRFDLVVNNLTGLAYTTGEIKMESDGKAFRPLVHIKDVCRAVELVLKSPVKKTYGQIFNLGKTASNFQIKKIAKTIGSELPGCRISYNKKGADKRNYKVNFSKIKKYFPEFSGLITLKEGIKELVNVYKEVNLNKKIFSAADYTRLARLKSLLENKKLNSDLYWSN